MFTEQRPCSVNRISGSDILKIIIKEIFHMGKTFKKLFSLFLVGCMTVGLCVGASAATTAKMSLNQVEFDTPHGHYFNVSGNSNRVLNQYTSGVPVNGTKVTTWTKEENEPTQAWDIGYLSNGRFIIVTNSDRTLAIDYDRNYTYPTVQLYTWVNDYYDDVVLSEGIYGLGDSYIKLANRDRYIYVTNTNTSVYNANGKVCEWSPNGTYWHHEV